LEEDVAFRVLGAGNFPDHGTVNRFRREHLEEFAGIFRQVVKLAREMKLLRMGTLAIDGTKVRANASKHKAMSYGRRKEEGREIKAGDRGVVAARAGG
jgi:transposase